MASSQFEMKNTKEKEEEEDDADDYYDDDESPLKLQSLSTLSYHNNINHNDDNRNSY